MNTYVSSALGILSLRVETNFLRELHLGDAPKTWVPAPIPPEIRHWLDVYFSGKIPPSARTLPLAPEGTAFQKLIWEILLDIPYGQVVTYGSVAKEAARRLGRSSMSSQAVGQAVGANPIPLLIPCHRVLASGGKIGGFSCGIALKKKLLALEKINLF